MRFLERLESRKRIQEEEGRLEEAPDADQQPPQRHSWSRYRSCRFRHLLCRRTSLLQAHCSFSFSFSPSSTNCCCCFFFFSLICTHLRWLIWKMMHGGRNTVWTLSLISVFVV
ncbi:hypothetical protein ACOSQ3_003824 [Xanthoceras sorbifolium]